MSECIRFGCLEHRRDGYWCEQDQAWVHADGWPCEAGRTVPGPPEQSYWEAPDGTVWFYTEAWGEWTGWQPGEDGHWQWPAARFRKLYPDAPRWDLKAVPR